MLFNKIVAFLLLSILNVAQSETKRGTRAKLYKNEDKFEKIQADVEIWERWMQSSSMSVPTPKPQKKPAKAPVVPTASPTPCIGTPDDLLKILSQVSTLVSLETPNTPQNKAYLWLLSDPLYCYNDPKIIQRYIMALTYFSTGGEGWTNCGQNATTSACDTNKCKQTGTDRWLSDSSECDWCGANCNVTNHCITAIDLDSINQTGVIPYELQNLTILETLAFQRGNIKGTIPATLGNLKELKDLDLNFNNITGTIPDSIYSDETLEQLDLNDNNLEGTISPKIGNLPNLFFLQLGNDSPSGKNNFIGSIPSEVGTLTKMLVFTANDNSFSGSLPNLSKLTSLNFLDVSDNDLTGRIDTTNWANMPNLDVADFSSNKFTGSIPDSFGKDKKLRIAAFDDNDFTGSMPSAICDLRAVSLTNLTADCLSPPTPPPVGCAFPSCCTACF